MNTTGLAEYLELERKYKELQEAADKLAEALESAINGHIDSTKFERFMKLLAEYSKLKGK